MREMEKFLDKINSPSDLQRLSVDELKELAEEIRGFITESVSKCGGHLASNLGVVEATIALHRVFDFARDRLLWDVGHQCYAHKILTGRKAGFAQLRKFGGVSGFPSPTESEYDQFVVGHAGTAIPTAIGMALGAQKQGTDERIVAFVGDASIVNGLSLEALNIMGLVKRQLLVVLNDNSMAIDVTQGSLARFLSRARLSNTYEDIRRRTDTLLEHLPVIGRSMEEALRKLKKALRMAVSPSQLFESLDIPYFGPVDGHDIESLIQLFGALSKMDHPAILHIYTKKGKGFTPADADPRRFHSTGPFTINGDIIEPGPKGRSFTDAFGDALVQCGERDERIVAITAAMPDGTGLGRFRQRFGERYYDVGIAEGSAVDIAAGLAKKGLRPVVCIYSTFLQRALDEIFQEVVLQGLPVVFCIDRAGVVGPDGPTHHGLMDVGFLRMLPGMAVASCADEAELQGALEFALRADGPVAIRYPKDIVADGPICEECERPFERGRAVFVRGVEDADAVIVSFGPVLQQALAAADELEAEHIHTGLINARFAAPIDERIISLAASGIPLVTVEDHYTACGFGSAVLEAAAARQADHPVGSECEAGPTGLRVVNLGVPGVFVAHNRRTEQLQQSGVCAERIVDAVKRMLVTVDKREGARR